MQHELKTVGASGQISVGKALAGKHVRVETRDDGSILITPVVVVPEREMWMLQDPDKSRIDAALMWAKKHPARATDLDALFKKAGMKR